MLALASLSFGVFAALSVRLPWGTLSFGGLAARNVALRQRFARLRLFLPPWFFPALWCSGGLGALFLLRAGALGPSAGLVVLTVGAPFVVLRLLERRRERRLDEQVVPFLDALLRSLGAVPALGEALREARGLVDAPLSEELVETCDEVSLGLSLEQALTRLSERVPSRNLRIALMTLRVGQRTGGRLETILRTTVDALREIARLEGVLRTKTSEGRAQTIVIGVLPLPLVFAIRAIEPDFFEPLLRGLTGHAVLAAVAALWLSALLLAHRILQVEV